MWTDTERERYEKHLKENWSRDGEKLPKPRTPSLRLDSAQSLAGAQIVQAITQQAGKTPVEPWI